MSLQAQGLKLRSDAIEARLITDLRRHRRVQISLGGRYMRADRREYECTLKDISVGGAALLSPEIVELNERLVIYVDHLGGLEASVTRIYPNGFGVQFKISTHKREKLAAQITWLINREDFPEEAGRQHERVGTAGRRSRVKLHDGIVVDVDVLDISASGASIGTPARPPLGSAVILANIPGLVARHHDRGFGMQFIDMQDVNSLRLSLV
ncbi:MAG: PilZ domain-containing protein [Hyphomicrobium sp.]